jgi:hypothetical protein
VHAAGARMAERAAPPVSMPPPRSPPKPSKGLRLTPWTRWSLSAAFPSSRTRTVALANHTAMTQAPAHPGREVPGVTRALPGRYNGGAPPALYQRPG